MKERLGVFCSGGDSPGMNAAIRAVVRTALYLGYEPVGIYRGYDGLIDAEMQVMDANSVSGIIQRGGSILRAGRSKRFLTEEGRAQAYKNLKRWNISRLVAIGGDGTFRGAAAFLSEYPDLQILGIPGTIDNDLNGTDLTLGFDTAVNIAVEAVDRLQDTAAAMGRLFLVEVMGRDSGFIALHTAVASGAEAVLIPETPTDFSAIIKVLERGWQRKRTSSIIIVAEGDEAGGALKTAEELEKRFPHYEIRATILGHIQRGGAPTAIDRILGSKLGAVAVERLHEGASGAMVGTWANEIILTPFERAIKGYASPNPLLLKLVEVLSL
ncbi:MAG: ATP-dependent 6-phosphofructokinase [Bacteroidia bacterium]|nr:6-phosphofructokinase [Bacteroidia bacterium]MDW8133941.1 ATP-dependent 6-phosphofructokinase [Bacteroidia bacterium]